jgi:very-short-patch-repair endonuclease
LVELLTKPQLGYVLHACEGDRDRAASVVGERQRGIIDTEQLQLLGLSRAVVSHRLHHGLLHRVFRGVYLMGHPVPPPGALEVAAVLACHRRVLIANLSAAALFGFTPSPSEVMVLTRTGRARSRPGLVVNRTDTLLAKDIVTRNGLPVTSPLRTMVDLAAHGYPYLERALSNAHAAGWIEPDALAEYLEQRAGLPGVPALRALAGAEARGFTRSQNERRLRTLCRQARLPQPLTNVKVCGWEVDFFWPRERLVVEVDAFNTHGHSAQFERDRRKQADLMAAGHPVLRFTDRGLHHEPIGVIADLASTLALMRPGADVRR